VLTHLHTVSDDDRSVFPLLNNEVTHMNFDWLMDMISKKWSGSVVEWRVDEVNVGSVLVSVSGTWGWGWVWTFLVWGLLFMHVIHMESHNNTSHTHHTHTYTHTHTHHQHPHTASGVNVKPFGVRAVRSTKVFKKSSEYNVWVNVGEDVVVSVKNGLLTAITNKINIKVDTHVWAHDIIHWNGSVH
jgi:hypothetical protein